MEPSPPPGSTSLTRDFSAVSTPTRLQTLRLRFVRVLPGSLRVRPALRPELAFLTFDHVLLQDRQRQDLVDGKPRSARGRRRLEDRSSAAGMRCMCAHLAPGTMARGVRQWCLLAATPVMRSEMQLCSLASAHVSCGGCSSALLVHVTDGNRHFQLNCSRQSSRHVLITIAADWLLLSVTQLPRCTGMYSHSRDAV